jgi:hypothetical protein
MMPTIALLLSLLFPRYEVLANQIILKTHQANLPVIPVLLIIQKESQFDIKAFNPRDTDGKQKHGLLQYDVETFNHLKKKADMPKLNIKKWDDQLTLFFWAAKNGEGWRWPSLKKSMKETTGWDISGF